MAMEFPARPVTGVAVVVWRGDRLLLVRRKNDPGAGHWALPGGSQDLGEDLAETARREVREETATECRVLGIVDAYDVVERDPSGRVRFHYVIVGVNAMWTGGEAVAGDDALDVRWVTEAEALALVPWPQTHEVIRRAARGR
jgi:ADP-ribose pyrophosphatase YjhB (NUDIX family)